MVHNVWLTWEVPTLTAGQASGVAAAECTRAKGTLIHQGPSLRILPVWPSGKQERPFPFSC